MSKSLMNTMEDVGKTTQQLLLVDQFFCYFLSGIDRLVLYDEGDDPETKDKFVPITGVGKSANYSYALYINAKGWEKLSKAQESTGIKGLKTDQLRHEGLHISYTHPSMQDQYKHVEIFAIAADLEINQYLNSITAYNKLQDHGSVVKGVESIYANPKLSDEQKKQKLQELMDKSNPFFMTLDTFGWGADTNKGSSYYYEKLLELAKKEDQKSGGGGTFGKMLQALRDKGEGEEGTPGAAYSQMLGNGNWKDFRGKDCKTHNEILNNKVKMQVKEILDSNKNLGIGNLPAGIQAQLQALLQDKPPVTDWKRLLRLFTAKAISYYTKTSRRKLNKRNPEFAAIKIKSLIRIFVTIDTSGSMSDSDIKEVLAEVENIRKSNKALLDLGECDAELYVKDICKVGKQTIMTKDHVNGRGGTSVEPAIDYVNKNAGLYTAFIYLTDGWVPPPREKCKVPMVTVITKSGASEAEVEKLRECKGFGLVIKTEKLK